MSPPDTPLLGALRALTVLHDRLGRLSLDELVILEQVVEERHGVKDWDTAAPEDVARIADMAAILAIYIRHREKRVRLKPPR